jgi:hypothetical protein
MEERPPHLNLNPLRLVPKVGWWEDFRGLFLLAKTLVPNLLLLHPLGEAGFGGQHVPEERHDCKESRVIKPTNAGGKR